MDAADRWLYAWGLGYTAVGAASLLIPLYAISLGGGAFVVGALASTAAFAGVPGAILWGFLAGRTGRRRIFVLIALAATALVLAATPFVRSVYPLIAVNALLWFVVSAASPVLNLLVVDRAPEREWDRRIALLNTWQGYGWVAGLVLGSVWTPIGALLLGPARSRLGLFGLCAAAAALGLLLAVRWLPRETTVTPGEVTERVGLVARIDRGAGRYVRTVPFATTRLYWGLRSIESGRLRSLLPGRLRAYLFAVALFSAGFAAFWGPLPAYLARAYADEQVFWFFLASNVASAVFYSRAGAWATRWGAGWLQTRALAVRVALFPLVGVLTVLAPASVELPILVAVFALIGLTWAAIAVTATGLVTRLADDSRGTALGAYTAVAGVGGGAGSVLGGLLAGVTGYLVAFVAAGAIVLSGVLVVALGVGRRGPA